MSNRIIESRNSELLKDLSQKEQESVAGGFGFGELASFFFQQTNISTFGENYTTFSGNGGDASGTSASRTGYRSSQTTLAFSFFPSYRSHSSGSSRMRRTSRRSSASRFWGMIFSLMGGGFDD